MRPCRLALVSCASLLFAVGSLRSAPIEPEHLPADTDWLVHLDMTKLAGSQFGQLVHDRSISRKQKGETWKSRRLAHFMAKRLGIDPFKDVTGVTLAGQAGRTKRGVLLLTVKGEAQGVMDFLTTQSSHQSIEHDDVTIHTWAGPDHRRDKHDRWDDDDHDDDDDWPRRNAVARVELDRDTSLLIAGHRPETVASVLDVIDGDRDSLEDAEDGLLEVADVSDEVVFFAAARKLDRIPGPMRHSSVARVTRQLNMSLALERGEDERIIATLALRASDETRAGQVEQLARGMVALAQLKAGGHDEHPLALIAQAAEIERDEAIVRLRTEAGTRKMIHVMDELFEDHHHHKHKKRHGERKHDEDDDHRRHKDKRRDRDDDDHDR